MKNLTVKQLKKRMADGYAARNELDRRQDIKLNKQNASMVGMHQKFRNSYGSGSEPWWLYRKILSVNGRWCKAFQFQLASDGRITIEVDKLASFGQEWLTIDEQEYTKAWEALEDAMYSEGSPLQNSVEGK